MNQPGGYPPQGQQFPGAAPVQAYGQQPGGQFPPQQYGQPPAGNPYGAPQPGHPGTGPQYPQPGPQYGHPGAPQHAQPPQHAHLPQHAQPPHFGGAPSGPQFGQPAPQFGHPGHQQPLPGQQPGQPDPPGLTVDAGYHWVAFLLGLLTKPKIKINGQQVPNTKWGTNHIPVQPGQYHVWVATPWLFDMGPNQLPVQIGSGPGTRVYYQAPAVIFLKGAIGLTPQKTPGIVFIYITWVLVGLLILLNIVLAFAAAGL